MREISLRILAKILTIVLGSVAIWLWVGYLVKPNTLFLILGIACTVLVILTKMLFEIMIRNQITKTDQQIREKVKEKKD